MLGVFGCENDGSLESPVIEEEDFVGIFVSGFDDGFTMTDLGIVDDGVCISRVVEEFELESHSDVGLFSSEGSICSFHIWLSVFGLFEFRGGGDVMPPRPSVC